MPKANNYPVCFGNGASSGWPEHVSLGVQRVRTRRRIATPCVAHRPIVVLRPPDADLVPAQKLVSPDDVLVEGGRRRGVSEGGGAVPAQRPWA
jgi:hypothetical protein